MRNQIMIPPAKATSTPVIVIHIFPLPLIIQIPPHIFPPVPFLYTVWHTGETVHPFLSRQNLQTTVPEAAASFLIFCLEQPISSPILVKVRGSGQHSAIARSSHCFMEISVCSFSPAVCRRFCRIKYLQKLPVLYAVCHSRISQTALPFSFVLPFLCLAKKFHVSDFCICIFSITCSHDRLYICMG